MHIACIWCASLLCHILSLFRAHTYSAFQCMRLIYINEYTQLHAHAHAHARSTPTHIHMNKWYAYLLHYRTALFFVTTIVDDAADVFALAVFCCCLVFHLPCYCLRRSFFHWSIEWPHTYKRELELQTAWYHHMYKWKLLKITSDRLDSLIIGIRNMP